MAELSQTQKKNYARTLFMEDKYTIQQIADEVSVNPKTISRWIEAEKWKGQRKSLTTTRSEQLSLLHDILAKMNAEAKQALEDDDPETKPNADGILKIAAAIQKLEREAGVGEMIQTVMALVNFVQREDIDAAKLISKWGFIFIQDKMATVK